MDPDLVLAVMQVESRFDRFAVSSAGAQGLMQVMPFWRNEIGRPQDNLTQIETNVRYGTAILAQYLSEARGDLIDALARYNGSRGRLNYPELVVYAYRARWQTQTTDDLPKLQAGCMAYGLAACNAIKSARTDADHRTAATLRFAARPASQRHSPVGIDDHGRRQHRGQVIAVTRRADPASSPEIRCPSAASAHVNAVAVDRRRNSHRPRALRGHRARLLNALSCGISYRHGAHHSAQ